jgi:hypothetical protein
MRLAALGCVVLAGGLLAPPTASAEPAKSPTLLETAKAVTARQTAMKERQAGQSNPAPQTDLRAGSFFKTPAGIATLVIFGAGVGYAIYSSSNDRIRSEGR